MDMKFKGNKKLKLASYIAIIGILALVVGTSFALFNTVVESSENQVIKVGAIALQYTETGTSLKNANLTIQTDEAALASSNYYSFSIKNIGSEKAYYKVMLIDEEGKTNTLDYQYVRANVTIDGIQGNVFNLQEVQNVIEDGTIEVGDTKEYILRLWLNFGDLTDDEIEQELNKEAYLKIKVVAEQIPQTLEPEVELDPSGANAPELATNMIPVVYNESENTWVKADKTNSNNSWFNYNNKIWANAVTVTSTNRDTYLKATPGTPISMDDINTMWVWIPRFSATTNTLDCSTLVNPTAEEYPQCYQNLSATDKQKAMAAMQQMGFEDPEQTVNDLLNGKILEFNGDYGDLQDAIEIYNNMAAPDSISIDYSTLIQDRVVLGANGGTQENPGAFNIDFVSTSEIAHDAFTFGNDEYAGIWVGKFETSHPTLSESTTENNLSCVNDTCENAKGIEILPNKVSLRYNNVSNIFYAGRSMEQAGNNYGLISSEIDTHMMKNSEWGAVVYLSQSIYGRCTSKVECEEIGINNNGNNVDENYIIYTGYGAPAGSDDEEDDDEYPYVAPQPYNTTQGMGASTTGNIYGVYDMSGGSWEYVMGVYSDGNKLWSGQNSDFNSGFNGCLGEGCTSENLDGVAFPETKYYNTYTTIDSYLESGLQHALVDTVHWYNDSLWINISPDSPWYARGGNFFNAGMFGFGGATGSIDSSSLVHIEGDIGFRIALNK